MESKRYNITEKDLLVIDYFIMKESDVLGSENATESHFYSYPAKIEKDLEGTISRVHAKEVCNKYEKMGIFSFEMRKPPRQKNETKYFYLNSDLKSFKKIIRIVLDNSDIKNTVRIFGYDYIQSRINEDLIRKTLNEKDAIPEKVFDLFSWEESEASLLFKDYLNSRTIYTDFSIEKLIKAGKTYPEIVAEMTDGDIDSFSIYVQRKIERIDSEKGLKINQFYPVQIMLKMPVLDFDNNNINESITKIESLNEDVFKKYPSLKTCHSALKTYYNKWQQNCLITPILLLIKSSPSALGEFLCEKWELGDSKPYEHILTGTFDPVMEKLLFLTIGDLASSGSYPKNELIDETIIFSNVTKVDGTEKNELMSVIFNKYKEMYFTRSFSVESLFGDDNAPKRSSFSFYDQGITYQFDILKQLLEILESITDFPKMLEYLKDTEKPVCKILHNHFSPETKNLVKYIDTESEIPKYLEITLKNDLRNVLLKENWSELLYIGFDELSEISKEKFKDYLDILKRDRANRSDHFILFFRIELAKHILKDVFGEALSYEY
ncbi:hypothetical protein J7W08_03695 [Methanococcoides orientis]|uniref:hypothetical protein n=1 Tax=Methanococcoides orientis TaxID=2822137 RepID=UPI001E4C470A|nr:hypothetical protein [Methanococcoides orientis]UGV41412.1 hypothetical protein J7W08_03695 [Methanococcoides orientis]